MGWASRNKVGKPPESVPSEVARSCRVKHVPEMWAAGKGFRDTRGVAYMVAPDGSLRRAHLIVDPATKEVKHND